MRAKPLLCVSQNCPMDGGPMYAAVTEEPTGFSVTATNEIIEDMFQTQDFEPLPRLQATARDAFRGPGDLGSDAVCGGENLKGF